MRLRTIRTQQPPGDARLSGIALAHGALSAQFAPGVRVNQTVTTVSSMTQAYGPGGRGMYNDGTKTSEVVALPRAIADTWTLIALVDWAALGSITSVLDCDTTASGFTRVFQFRKTTANKMEVIRFNTGGSPFTVTTTGSVVTNRAYFVAMRTAGLSYSVTLGTETVNGVMTGTPRPLGTQLIVGAGGAGSSGLSSQKHNGRIYGWVLFDKFLDASDLMDYAANFWIAADARRTPVFYSLGGSVYNESLSEAASASDSLSAAAAFGGALTEAASASDSLAAVAALAGDLSEAASASDVVAAAAAYADSLSEAASASESISASGAVVGALIEAASADDALSASAALADALSESASAADELDASASFGSVLSESAAATDDIDGSIGAATYSGALSEAASADDSIAASAAFADSIAEFASASDLVAASAALTGALSESVSAADDIDGSIGAATYAAELVESVSASDSLTAAAVYASAIVEAVTAEDAMTAGAVLAAVLSEVASADDSVSASLVLAAAIFEAVSAADGWSGSVGSQVFEVELSEAVSAADIWSALGVLARHGVRGASATQRQAYGRLAQIQRGRRLN